MADAFDSMKEFTKNLKKENISNENNSECEQTLPAEEDKILPVTSQTTNFHEFEDKNNVTHKICPVCNNRLDMDALFCSKCGSKFQEQQEPVKLICPKCEKEYSKDDVFCKFCGTKLKNDVSEDLKCSNCGTGYTSNDTYCGECGAKLPNFNTSIGSSEIEPLETTYTPQMQANLNSQYEIKCPFCGSSVQRYIKKCPHCGEWLSGVSHFGCGSFMMLLSTILGLILFIAGNSVEIPIFGAVGGGVILVLCFLYFLPSLISDWRGHDSKLAIFIVNLLFGWTFIGWFAALIFSFTGRSR